MQDTAPLQPKSAEAVKPAALPLPPLRSGYRSSEFGVLVATLVGLLTLSLEDKVPGEWSAAMATIGAIAFAVVRATLKRGHLELARDLAEATLDNLPLNSPDLNGTIRALPDDELPRRADGTIDYGTQPEAVRPKSPIAGSGTVALAAAAILLLGGCQTSEPAFYLQPPFLTTAGIVGGLWLLGLGMIVYGVRKAPVVPDDDGGRADESRDSHNHGAE